MFFGLLNYLKNKSKYKLLDTLSWLKFPRYRKNNVYIHWKSFISSFVYIGEYTNINGPCYIAAYKQAPVYIGKYCAIAHNLRIRTRNHDMDYANLQDKLQIAITGKDLAKFKGPVNVGNNVWIGDNVIILSGVSIGDGAVIGAGSVVTKSIPPFAVAAGVPAIVRKFRFSEHIIEQLLEIKWWDWPIEKILKNKKLFATPLTNIDNIYSLIEE